MGTSVHDAFITEQRLGTWYHVVYLNGWTRREDVPNQTVLIVKPDKNQRIHLDLATQTYYTTPSTDSPQTAASTRAVMCSASTTVDHGPKTLDGVATEAFETAFAAARMSVTVTRYASSYAEPPERTATGDLIPYDCLATAAHTGPPMPTDHIAFYQTMTATNGPFEPGIERGLWYGQSRGTEGGEHEYSAAEFRFAGGIGGGGGHARLGAVGARRYSDPGFWRHMGSSRAPRF